MGQGVWNASIKVTIQRSQVIQEDVEKEMGNFRQHVRTMTIKRIITCKVEKEDDSNIYARRFCFNASAMSLTLDMHSFFVLVPTESAIWSHLSGASCGIVFNARSKADCSSMDQGRFSSVRTVGVNVEMRGSRLGGRMEVVGKGC